MASNIDNNKKLVKESNKNSRHDKNKIIESSISTPHLLQHYDECKQENCKKSSYKKLKTIPQGKSN